MNKHTQIRRGRFWRATESTAGKAVVTRLFDGLPAFIEPEDLPALAHSG